MTSIFRSLVWKELHEHKWKLAAMVAVLWGVEATVIAFADTHDMFALAVALVGMCIVPLALFIGLGSATSERSRNTFPFLQSLPMPLWRVAMVKLVVGLLTVAISIVLAVAFAYLCLVVANLIGHSSATSIKEIERTGLTGIWFLDCILLLVPLAASIYVWAVSTGVNQRNEVRGGAVAAAVLAGWFMLLLPVYLVLASWISSVYTTYAGATRDTSDAIARTKWLLNIGLSTMPGGYIKAFEQAQFEPQVSRVPIYVVAAVTNAALMAFYVWRFGKLSNYEIRSAKTAKIRSTRPDWLPPPRRWRLTSMVWKQARESGPLALAGVAGSIVIALFVVATTRLQDLPQPPPRIGIVYTSVAMFIGFLVALVTGIGIFLSDFSTRLNDFWRSRPIQPDAWFWTRFVTGIVVASVAIYAPIALFAVCGVPVWQEFSNSSVYQFPLMQLAVFAAAVVTTCLVRHAVYAAILSVSAVYIGTLIGLMVCMFPQVWKSGSLRPLFADPSDRQVAFALLVSFVISTMLAWLAVRFDWGKKSRY